MPGPAAVIRVPKRRIVINFIFILDLGGGKSQINIFKAVVLDPYLILITGLVRELGIESHREIRARAARIRVLEKLIKAGQTVGAGIIHK